MFLNQSPKSYVNCLCQKTLLNNKYNKKLKGKRKNIYKKILNTFAGSQGRRLIKKNCLSVELLPTPWAQWEMKPETLFSVTKDRITEWEGLESHIIRHILKVKRKRNRTPADVLVSANVSVKVHLCSILMNREKNTDLLESSRAPVEQVHHGQRCGFETTCFSSPPAVPTQPLACSKEVGLTQTHSRTFALSPPAAQQIQLPVIGIFARIPCPFRVCSELANLYLIKCW